MPSCKHHCIYCDKRIFSHKFGAHIFSHQDELKRQLSIIAKHGRVMTLPITLGAIQLCMVSKKVWLTPTVNTARSPAIKHMMKPEFNEERQLAALYAFLSMDMPEAPKLVANRDVTKEALVSKVLDNKNTIISEKDFEILKLKVELSDSKKLPEKLKRDNQNALDLIKTKLMDEIEVRNELIKVMWQFIPVTQISMVQKAISEITNDEEKLNKIKDLSTRLINTEYDISMSVSEPAPAPEPALVPERARVPEPPPTSIESPPPEPDHESESESESMHEPEPQQVKQKSSNDTCNIAGCGDSQHGHYFKCTSCLSTACNENDLTHCYKFVCEICNTTLCKICMKKYGSKLHIRCKNHQRNLDAITAQPVAQPRQQPTPVEPVKILSSQQQLFLNQNFRFQQGYRDEPINIIGKKSLVPRVK